MAAIRIEAENFTTLTGYQVLSGSIASGKKLIGITGDSPPSGSHVSSGTASTTFTGPTGNYEVLVSYYDENDGVSTVTASIDGVQIDSWKFDQGVDPFPSKDTLTTRSIAQNLTVKEGSLIQLDGVRDASEFARIDFIELVPLIGSPTTAPRDIAFQFNQGRKGVKQKGTFDRDKIQGTQFNDVLNGLGRTDVIDGKRGNDRITGDQNNDRLFGGSGDDQIDGGTGKDQIKGGSGQDRIFGGDDNDAVNGGNGRDLLQGDNGNDTLIGGAGDDFLVGGAGADILTGNAGQDVFVFNNLSEGVDRITDFNATDDVIDLRLVFASPSFSGSSTASRFSRFVDIVQVGANTEVRIDADGMGINNAFTTIATLTNVQASTIKPTNFVIA